jgi:hypothetical protein
MLRLPFGTLHSALRPAEVEYVVLLDTAFMEESLALVRLAAVAASRKLAALASIPRPIDWLWLP